MRRFIWLLLGIMVLFKHPLMVDSATASPFTEWTESPNDPIYNPYPVTDGEDYWPYVVYSSTQFDGNGAAFFYKMWHQGNNANGSIALSYSQDGVNWVLAGETNLTPAYHAVVLYDNDGFGGTSPPYKIWYWNGTASTTDVGVILTATSSDGLSWSAPQPITQNLSAPLLDGSFYFFQLYGPGFVIYNSDATSTPGKPYSFPYVMYYDIGTAVQTTVSQSIALAYSEDGILWSRFGTQPILIPSGAIATDWNATHLYRPSIVKLRGVYHLYYSGSNQYVDPGTTVADAHGLGHATSVDGINWVKDINPIFIYSDGVAWRNTRTYTPFVLFEPLCSDGSSPKMWFTGGTGLVTGQDQGIGLATSICLPPLPPSAFRGQITKCLFLNRTECKLRATWRPSSTENVIAYRIYRNGVLVAQIPFTGPLVFTTNLPNCSTKGYTITSLDINGQESAPIPLVLVS